MTTPTPLGPLPVLEDLGELSGKRVLVRLDLNVPLEVTDDNTSVADDFRIRAAFPTLSYLSRHGADVTVAAHLGRPEGQPDERYQMAPIRKRLEELGTSVELLENLRFSPAEEEGSGELAAALAEGHDLFVNDAFGAMHRPHASIVGLPRLLPSAAGRLVEKEMVALGPFLTEPPRPFVVVIGGAKVGDKLGLLKALSARADAVVVGGGMAFSFLAGLGHQTGDSILDPAHIEGCRELMAAGRPILLPVDFIAAAPGVGVDPQRVRGAASVKEAAPGDTKITGRDLDAGWKGLDIGPATSELFRETIERAGSVMWNGPMGLFEDPRFARGTFVVASAIASIDAMTVVGGGDSAAALERFGLTGEVGHISTGGGASLELLEHGDLPGLAALRESWARSTKEASQR